MFKVSFCHIRAKETHFRSLFVTYAPLLVNETMGWSPINKLGRPDIPYDEARDCGLYFKPAQTYFTVSPNEFTIFFPEDAHAPIIGEGTQRKLIGKLLI